MGAEHGEEVGLPKHVHLGHQELVRDPGDLLLAPRDPPSSEEEDYLNFLRGEEISCRQAVVSRFVPNRDCFCCCCLCCFGIPRKHHFILCAARFKK